MGFGEPKFPGDGVHGSRAQKRDETSKEYRAANSQFAAAQEDAWKEKMQEVGVDSENQPPIPEQQQAQKERDAASQMVADHFKGTTRIPDGILTPEETQVLSQMETLYTEQKAANPDQPVKFGLDDKSNEIYARLLHRLPLAIKEHGHTQKDQAKADEVRGKLGLEKQHQETTPQAPKSEETPGLITENKIEGFSDLENVRKAEKDLLQSLNSGKPDWRSVNSTLYSMLTTRSEFSKMKSESGDSATFIYEKFKTNLDQYKSGKEGVKNQLEADGNFEFDDTGAWLGIDTRPEAPESSDVSIKAYATLPLGETEFINHLPDLAVKLRQLAIDSSDSIKVKVPSGAGVLSRNDTIVVHFKKGENAEEVQKILGQWMNQHNITEEDREMGRAKIAADPKELNPFDGKKMSFSDLVAVEITKWVQQNYGKYDNETLANLATKYAIERSQNPPEIRK